ncbi:MAG: TetR/AcrR family transcriptional regulator [Jatrophihabitans sp.]
MTSDPRVKRTRKTVLRAASDLLAERGYEAFTIEAVVSRTGVAKTTIYRHWASRADLLHDVLSSAKPTSTVIDSGNLRTDLIALLCSVARATSRDVFLRSMPSLVVAAQRDPELRALHDQLAEERSHGLRNMLANACARGDLRDDCDLELLAQTLIGLVFVRRIFRTLPLGQSEVTKVVDMLLDGAAPTSV